ncbi:hypothetical protein HYPGJ_20612 [Hyphomicrobium sp. GJ21]|nr:hypothetical protein HYPGJ_20612 [Hyphomicrobium sp. GJ21]
MLCHALRDPIAKAGKTATVRFSYRTGGRRVCQECLILNSFLEYFLSNPQTGLQFAPLWVRG